MTTADDDRGKITDVLPLKGRLEEGIAAFPEELARWLILPFPHLKSLFVTTPSTCVHGFSQQVKQRMSAAKSVVKTREVVHDDFSALWRLLGIAG